MSCLPLVLFAMSPAAQEPMTVPESSGFEATSTHDDVLSFLQQLSSHEHAKRLVTTTLGATEEERDLVAVIAAEPPCATAEEVRASGKLRVLVNANIHAGEVEGKEAVQMLLRELAQGNHESLLKGAVLVFVPDFNPDGNDRISTDHRPTQNGPVRGVGTRANASGLDLNRDFIKAESASVRGMLAAFGRFDPHVFMDLHTTNGSHHGYHLTYSPSLAVNVDPDLDRFARETWIPQVRGQMAEKHEFRVYDYGNFPWRGGEKSWSTYDHRPRFGTNYYGLRNRLSMLSEAYSYVDYETRIAVTRAFVLETVRAAVAHSERIVALCEAADRRVAAGDDRDAWFRFGSELEPAWNGEILVGSVRRDGTRIIAEPEYEAQEMPVRIAFRGTRAIRYPSAWCVVDPSDEVVATLRRHGLTLARTTREVELRGQGSARSATT